MEYAMRLFLTVSSLFALTILTAQSPAIAAPQIIAVLPSDAGVPFACADGLCRADLSTYCLQRERPAPKRGTPYLPASAEDFKLVIETVQGTHVIDAAPHVGFVESRGFMAIAAVIEEPKLKALAKSGIKTAALRVGKAASLLPEPQAGDPNPLTEEEIAYVTKWRRQQGVEIVDAKPEARAVRVLAGLSNRLPASGLTEPAVFDRLWQDAIGDEFGPAAVSSHPALDRANVEIKRCSEGAARYSYGGIRNCLQFRHDDLSRDLNIEYWNTKPGS
jgi:hypothetical protein